MMTESATVNEMKGVRERWRECAYEGASVRIRVTVEEREREFVLVCVFLSVREVRVR